jgi:prepilin-type processing-associated H-X9-DG protein
MAETGENLGPLDYAVPRKRNSIDSIRRTIVLAVIASVVIVSAFLLLFNPTRSRAISPRVVSMSNLREIGVAILLYGNDHHGSYPDSFQTILLNEDVSSMVFVSPQRSETPADGSTTQATAANMTTGNISYVYLGKGLSQGTVTPKTVVAYEKLLQPNVGTNVLFGDGHVEFVGPVTAGHIDGQAAAGVFPVTAPPAPPSGYP